MLYIWGCELCVHQFLPYRELVKIMLVCEQINDVASPSASSMSGRAAIVQELYTVLPECLKPRHEHFPPICTDLRITPAFANAPRDGDITICYTFITHMKVRRSQ